MTTLDQARAISDALTEHEAIPNLVEVTELPPEKDEIMWRLATMLSDFEVTRPMWEAQ